MSDLVGSHVLDVQVPAKQPFGLVHGREFGFQLHHSMKRVYISLQLIHTTLRLFARPVSELNEELLSYATIE